MWLTYWEETKWGLDLSFYEGIYAMLGLTQAIFTFLMGATMGILSYLASNNLHHEALQNVFYSPMSVFDTQPLGRILGVFGKDIDSIDNQLADALRMMAMTLSSVSLRGGPLLIPASRFGHYHHRLLPLLYHCVSLVSSDRADLSLVAVGVGYWYL